MAEHSGTPKPTPAERTTPEAEPKAEPELSHAMQEALRVTANLPDGDPQKQQIIADAAKEEDVNTEQMRSGGTPAPEPEPTTRAAKPADKPGEKPAS